jgi:predicted ATPase
VLEGLPDTPECTQPELGLQTALGSALMVTKGFAAPEVEHAYARARELCRQVGDTPELFAVLWGLWYFYFARAELQTARELGAQCLLLAQRLQAQDFLLQAHRVLGMTLFWRGELVAAREHLEQGITRYDPQQHRSLAFRYGTDPAVGCQCFAALALWCLGYPAQALEKTREALALAWELSHPLSLVYALTFAARLHQDRREGHVTQERAEAAMRLSTEQGFPEWVAVGSILRGWALSRQGWTEEGIAQMCQGLVDYRTLGGELWRAYGLSLLAEAYGKAGQAAEGLRVLAEGLVAAHHSGQRLYEAELYRLNGELLLQQAIPDAQAAEACFRQASEIARQQPAKSLELRVSMSLARLWQQQGKQTEAYELLAPLYGWFTEGFDTADLQEAKALLDKLL